MGAEQGVGKVGGRLSDVRGFRRVDGGAARPRRNDRWCLNILDHGGAAPPCHEGYSGGGLEGIECECLGDGLLECFQGSPVGGVEDSPGLDVGDGALFRPGGSG